MCVKVFNSKHFLALSKQHAKLSVGNFFKAHSAQRLSKILAKRYCHQTECDSSAVEGFM